MHTCIRFIAAALCLGALAPLLPAQSTTTATAANNRLLEAVKFRADMAAAVVNGTESADAALIRLAAAKTASGLNIDSGADLAFAAIDIGHRLLAVGKLADAEKFFLAAEKALVVVLVKTPDTAVRDKTQYLKALAFIRGRFLDKPDLANANLEQAIGLSPDDPTLKTERERLVKDRAEIFRDKPKG